MHEYLWFGVDLGDLMFSGLKVTSAASLAVTCVVFALLTVGLEWLRVWGARLRRDHATRVRRAMRGACSSDRSDLLSPLPGTSARDPEQSRVVRTNYVAMMQQIVLYTTSTSLNYIVMLALMLFNGYLIVAILLGITIGYFLFGHIFIKYRMESIREKSKVVTVCVPECEEPEGSTPPLLQGMGSSERNLYNCEAYAQSQRLLEKPDGGECAQTRREDCCDPKTKDAKKTTDASKIKSSKDSTSSPKCCAKSEDLGSELDGEDTVIDVDREKEPCCDKNKEPPQHGVCVFKNSPN